MTLPFSGMQIYNILRDEVPPARAVLPKGMISPANNIFYVNVLCYIDYFGCLMDDDNIRPRCYARGHHLDTQSVSLLRARGRRRLCNTRQPPSYKMFLFIAFYVLNQYNL